MRSPNVLYLGDTAGIILGPPEVRPPGISAGEATVTRLRPDRVDVRRDTRSGPRFDSFRYDQLRKVQP